VLYVTLDTIIAKIDACRYLVWLIIVSKKKSSPILRIEELYNFMASAVKRKKTLGD